MDRKEELGSIGEQIVADYLGATLSEDKYDSDKDMILNGQTIEVKTQARWKVYNCFTVDQSPTNNQINKCKNVDRLIFVEFGKFDEIRIYESLSRSYKTKYPRGWATYCFPVDDCALLHKLKDKVLCDRMISLSKTSPVWLT